MANPLRSVFFDAVTRGDAHRLAPLLEKDPTLAKERTPRPRNRFDTSIPLQQWMVYGSALMLAAQQGHTECVRLLLPHSEVDQRDTRTQLTALMLAAFQGHTDCVRLLLDHSDPNLLTQGDNALVMALRADHPACVELLAARTLLTQTTATDNDVFSLAIECSSAQSLSFLLAHCNPEARRMIYEGRAHDQKTPLMSAAKKGDFESAALLLPLSNPLARNNHQYTALMMAVASGNLEIVKMLLPLSDPLAQNKYGRTALMLSTVSPNTPVEMVRLLLPLSDPLAREQSGLTALLFAARCGSPQALQVLLPISEHGATNFQGLDAIALSVQSYLDSGGHSGHLACFDLLAPITPSSRLAELVAELGLDGLTQQLPQASAILEHQKLQHALATVSEDAQSIALAVEPVLETLDPGATHGPTPSRRHLRI